MIEPAMDKQIADYKQYGIPDDVSWRGWADSLIARIEAGRENIKALTDERDTVEIAALKAELEQMRQSFAAIEGKNK